MRLIDAALIGLGSFAGVELAKEVAGQFAGEGFGTGQAIGILAAGGIGGAYLGGHFGGHHLSLWGATLAGALAFGGGYAVDSFGDQTVAVDDLMRRGKRAAGAVAAVYLLGKEGIVK